MKRMLTAALALLLALSLCACGAQDTDDTPTYPAAFSGLETLIDTAREEGRLTVCGTGDEAYMTALCEKFEELFDIKTTYRAITAAQAGSARGDVWFGGSADTCRTLAADGKLLTYTPVHAADLTDAAYGDADGYWYGVSVDAVVFAVNSDVLRRMTISAPKDWADLTDPVYQELIWLPTYRSTEIGRLTAYSAALRLGRDKGLHYLAALDNSVQFYTAADDLPRGEPVGEGKHAEIMGQRCPQNGPAAEGGGQARHHFHGDIGKPLGQFQQGAGHPVNARIAGADEGDGLAALRRFQRPAAAVQLLGHAGGVIFLFRVIGAHEIQIDRIAAQHLGFLQGALRLCGQKLRVAGAKADHEHGVIHAATSNLGHRGGAPAQR